MQSLRRQNVEATFFQMLTLHNTIVNSIDLRLGGGKEMKGRDCFQRFYADFRECFRQSENINAAYRLFWDRRQQDLSHYFRYLFNVIRFVDESEFET
jgi:hypothetical protein